MSALSKHVSVQIVLSNVGVARAGFGVAMVLSATAGWVERSRVYGNPDDVATDLGNGGPEHLAAEAYFSQSPHPEELIVGRAANKPTQQYTMGAVVAQNADAYQVNLIQPGATVTNPITYTSDASATFQEIHNGLLTLLNAIAGKNYTATFAPLASLVGIVVTADSTTDKLNHVAHGWNTGDGPIQFTNSGGGLPAGIVALTDYFVIKFDADNFKVATSLANALAGTNVDITTNGTGTQTATPTGAAKSPILPFLVTGNASGNWFSLEVVDTDLLSNKQTHADPGIAADLTAIRKQNDDWYALITSYDSSACVLAAAAAIEPLTKLYFPCVPETDALNTTVGNGDTLDALHTAARTRTAGSYHPSPGQFFQAAWLGAVLPIDPGQDDWKWHQLSGPNPVTLTDTQETNLRARKANTYQRITSDHVITWEGTVASGDFIDNIRGEDWIQDDMAKGVFGKFAGQKKKVPLDNKGIAVVESEVRSSLKRSTTAGILTPDFEPVIVVPDSSEISASDRAARRLTGISAEVQFAGAIHSVVLNITIEE